MKIITNNVPRDLKYGYEMPEKLRSDFDYLYDLDNHEFFVYRGQWYDIGEFMRVPEEFKPWHGYTADSYFSGARLLNWSTIKLSLVDITAEGFNHAHNHKNRLQVFRTRRQSKRQCARIRCRMA